MPGRATIIFRCLDYITESTKERWSARRSRHAIVKAVRLGYVKDAVLEAANVILRLLSYNTTFNIILLNM